MPQAKSRIALLIDADNATAAKIDAVLSKVEDYGVANVRRAYGNWTNPKLKSWESCLHEYAISPVQQFDYTKGKNATDAALIIDAMDLLYTQKIDAFAIISSDSDFTPLVMRVLANGLKVYGFGEKKTPSPFVRACSEFVYLETLVKQVDAKAEKAPSETPSTKAKIKTEVQAKVRKSGEQLKQDSKLINLLRSAISSIQDQNGWVSLSSVGTYISQQKSFDLSCYGYAQLSGLFEAIDLFEIDRKKNPSLVRIKPKG
jgi:uncharacterized protein (TIGR00288 family)